MIFLKIKKNNSLIAGIMGTIIILLSSSCSVEQVDSGDNYDFTIVPSTGGLIPSNCNDGVDNDGNGLADQNDPGNCGPGSSGEIVPPLPPNCADGTDNDEDTLTDTEDPDCAPFNDDGIAWAYLTDSIPGFFHLYDPDAVTAIGEQIPVVPPVLSNCDDGIDNDGDGDPDLEDDDCNPDIEGSIGEFAPPEIPDPPLTCTDGNDNDGNSLCDVEGCTIEDVFYAADPACEYNATTGKYGNDGAGELNSIPSFSAPPAPTPEAPLPANCDDGVDNDEDTFTDEADPDCAEGGSGELQPIPPPPTPPSLDPPVQPPPPVLQPPVDTEGTETANNAAETIDESDPDTYPDITVPPVENDYSASETAADSIFAASNAVFGEGADAATSDALELVEAAVNVPDDPTPEQVETAANTFADNIQAEIESGTGITSVDTAAVNTVLAQVANDSVLINLLAQFELGIDGSTMGYYNNIEIPMDNEFLGKVLDYEECVIGCGEEKTGCDDDVETQYQNCLGDCIDPYNESYTECIAQDSTTLADCIQASGTTYDNCAGGFEDIKVDCEEEALSTRTICTSSFDDVLNVCDATAQTVLDSCNAIIEDQVATCVASALPVYDQCVLDNNTAYGICTGAAGTAKNSCIDAAVNDREDCYEPVETIQLNCGAEVGTISTQCYTNVSDTTLVCNNESTINLQDNLTEAANQFAGMMEEAIALSATCDPDGDGDPSDDGILCPYGEILEDLANTLFMNQCFVAELNYDADNTQCFVDSLANAGICFSEEVDGTEDCNAVTEPGFGQCDEAYGLNEDACLDQYDIEDDVCDTEQEEYEDTVCDADYTNNTNECGITYGQENYQLCLDTWTSSDQECQDYWDDNTASCTTSYDNSMLECEAYFNENTQTCSDTKDESDAECDAYSEISLEACEFDLSIGIDECGSGCDIPNPCADDYQFCTQACHDAELGGE